MIYVVIAFLWVALCLYLILGGADFGAGIVELFAKKSVRKQTRDMMATSIGPIWEANHMWLIIAIVIMFVGFPIIYADLSNYLHIPLVIMLLGIIARGTSFTFRNYDVLDDQWHRLYAVIFTYSSVITPLFLGIIAASTVSGSIDTEAINFMDAYIYSWLTWFNGSVGLFTVTICGFLAAIYAVQMIADEDSKTYLRRSALNYTFAIFIAGALVFAVSFWKGIPLYQWIFEHPVGYLTVGLATVAVAMLAKALRNKKDGLIRVYAGFIVLMILVSVSYSHFPNLVVFKNGTYLSLLDHQGAEKSIAMLAWALLIGSCFILPFLFYLLYSFNKRVHVKIDEE